MQVDCPRQDKPPGKTTASVELWPAVDLSVHNSELHHSLFDRAGEGREVFSLGAGWELRKECKGGKELVFFPLQRKDIAKFPPRPEVFPFRRGFKLGP